MRIAVLADTHIPKRAKALPERAMALIKTADAIIHAGDFVSESFFQSLQVMAPTIYAVKGNNDIGVSLPEKIEFECDGVKLALIHDSGASKGRGKRMRKLFPNADIVVFGHSHIPMNERDEGLLLFNPGSPTDRRRQPKHTMGLIVCERGKFESSIIELE